MIIHARSDHKLHTAWCILARSVCESLSYDSRLIPPLMLADVEEQLAVRVKQLVNVIAGCEF
eukprot:6377256-Karenia_brevis.AAC.1